jgi:hypothetical protein
MSKTNEPYVGMYADQHGLTQAGRIILDAWVFGLLPEGEDAKGFSYSEIQNLMRKVESEWDKYGALPSRLPAELRERHARIYAEAMARARRLGWDPQLGDDEEV